VSKRLLFVVISALEPPALVGQLADTLRPNDVLVHHDHTKLVHFDVARENLHVIDNPKKTGWGNWGFVRAILHSVETALRDFEFDYLKLLSPTCLPLRPMADIQHAIDTSDADAHLDLFDLDEDDDQFMSYMHRVYLRDRTLLQRTANRMSQIYFGPDPQYQSKASLVVRRLADARANAARSMARGIALSSSRALRRWVEPSTPFTEQFVPAVGSTWIGMSRRACEYLLETVRSHDVVQHFQGLRLPDEVLFATVFRNAGFRSAPSLHYVSPFEQSHPRTIGPDELAAAQASGRLFARKFSTDQNDPTRRVVVEQVIGTN
jgi:hypothetical protein